MALHELPPPERLLRVNFMERRVRSSAGVPLVSPEFVAESGRRVTVVDVREASQVIGPLGHLPGVVVVPFRELSRVADVVGPDGVVIVVSNHSDRAGKAAQFLEVLGLRYVAAMDGGMTRWKAMGLATSRDPRVFDSPLQARQPLTLASGNEPLTRERLERHVGRPGAVRWMRLSAFLLRGRRSCVDGRDDHGVIGTPGGDAGEFALALAAYELAAQRSLTRAQVQWLLQEYVDTFGRFYMHSDTPTGAKFVETVKADPVLGPAVQAFTSPLDWRAFMRAPPPHLQQRLLELEVVPEALGCGHLKLMMTQPARYGVRPGLVADVLHAMWSLRWGGAPEIDFVVLGGEHNEAGVVNVVVDGELWAFSRVPLLSPNVDGHQVFINHPQVAVYLRKLVAEFLLRAEEKLHPDETPHAALADAMQELGAKHLSATLSVLAKGLPGFEVRFHADETCEVKALG